MVRLLIDRGADVDEVDLRTGLTPLHLVSFDEGSDSRGLAIRILLDANAHTDYTDQYGRLLEEYAQEWEIRDLLRINGNFLSNVDAHS